MTALVAQLRAIATRLEAAAHERHAALLDLRRVVALNPVSWDDTEPNADDFASARALIEQPGSSAPAGAVEAGEDAARPAAPSPADAPIEQPEPEDAVVEEGPSTAAAVGHPPAPVSTDAGAVRDETDAGPSSPESAGSTPASRSKKGPSPGNVIDVTCPCGRHFTWKPGLSGHQKHCAVYRAAATTPGEPVNARKPPHETPVVRNGREWWVCGRCPERFKTRDKRDDHERLAHAPIPRSNAVGTQRPLGHPHTPGAPGGGGMV